MIFIVKDKNQLGKNLKDLNQQRYIPYSLIETLNVFKIDLHHYPSRILFYRNSNKIYFKIPKTQDSQNNLIKTQVGELTLISKLTTKYSNRDSLVLEKGSTNRSINQNREFRQNACIFSQFSTRCQVIQWTKVRTAVEVTAMTKAGLSTSAFELEKHQLFPGHDAGLLDVIAYTFYHSGLLHPEIAL